MTNKKAELIYSLTCKYGSEYRTGVVSPRALARAQVKFLLDSAYCWEVGGDWWGFDCNGIDCNIPYIQGGEFGWRLQSNDNVVTAVKVLYEEVYSEEALRVAELRKNRAKKWRGRKISRRNRILDMQRLKRGELSSMPVRR